MSNNHEYVLNEDQIAAFLKDAVSRVENASNADIKTFEQIKKLFKKNVEDALDIVKNKNSEHKIVFLRSWNEWAEGNYMEPDLKFGHGYLDALKEVVAE